MPKGVAIMPLGGATKKVHHLRCFIHFKYLLQRIILCHYPEVENDNDEYS